ncbi:Protein of uncharacterised function (DUF3298) [Bergeriella denitrificans]|uniref:Protein of uncharacterized function (DUF3298) n=2 Tax=Bergeriella denitrificans TaxID=494 RepID=A0A378UI69_BERDE|nr:Protein of uncharacterised function (DUF3298) [Bergeriella denitrificans]
MKTLPLIVFGLTACGASAALPPALETGQQTVYEQSRCLPDQSCLNVRVTLPQTGSAAVDEAVKQAAFQSDSGAPLSSDALKQQYRTQFQETFNQLREDSQNGREGMEYYLYDDTDLLYQRGNTAYFRNFSDSYTGGAHHNYSARYWMVDVGSGKVLTLDDLLLPGTQPRLDKLLQEAYEADIGNKADCGNPAECARAVRDHKEFFALKAPMTNFMTGPDGLTFHYSPYEIGPWAAGAIELTISWYELQDIIKPQYRWFNTHSK